MTDLLGPGDAGASPTLATTGDVSNPAAGYTFFLNCTAGVPGTGTPIVAKWLNRLTQQIRRVISNTVVAQNNSNDDMLGQAIQSGNLNWAGTFGGSANALTATMSPAPAALTPGMEVIGIVAAANNAATTLTLPQASATAVPVVNSSGIPLVGGELIPGRIASFRYDGVYWQTTTTRTGQTVAHGGASYAYAASNLGTTVLRSNGGSPMLDTLPGSPVQLTAGGALSIFNNDATALLAITAGAGASLFGGSAYNNFVVIGPKQCVTLVCDGTNYWVTNLPTRTRLGANTTVYVSNAGSDSTGSGLTSAAAFATIQGMFNLLIGNFDFDGYAVTVQLENGVFAPAVISGNPVGSNGTASLVFNGNATPTDVTVSATGGPCFLGQDGADFTVQNMQLTGTGNSTGLLSVNGAVISFSNVAFASMGTGDHCSAVGGAIQITGNYSIVGGAGYHFSSGSPGSQINNSGAGAYTATLTGTPAFSGQFAFANINGAISMPNMTFSGSATGARYLVGLNGVIYTNGAGASFLPGNSAGSSATGGQYG